MRVVLFTGKGGVGKTTSAAATAVLAARAGATLVVSTDPAHSLADALGLPVGAEPTPVADGLHAQQVDPQARYEQYWGTLRGYLTTVLRHGGLSGVAAEEIVVPPGLDDLFALFAVRDEARSGRWDTVVVDCAPTAETLRLLTLPDVLGWYTDRLAPLHRRLSGVARPVLGRELQNLLPDDAVVSAVQKLRTALADVRDLLTDPQTSAVRLVLTPEAVVLAEARRTFTALALHGFVVDGAVVNRVIPDGDDPWRAGWAAAQRAQLAEARESFAGVPLRTAPYLPGEPVGVPALTELAEALYGDDDPVAAVPVEPPLRLDGDAVLSVALPLADRSEIALSRVADDLILTVAGRRRLLALPTVLRHRAVAGARLQDGRLEVRFEG
ncbi:ArsA family ATPase [Cryptosporangium arvum]|uniref:arsenite-transporting ATPase n=1 Tax=Cryptosporangium arvum DSM 44712 TaxID=927661 RepID=A0A010ZQD2_9ACTN|nr:ArsA family ATPase [Cryptosporangium arvum]EXG80884.1 arsenite-activated ATPase ArsA [Cryptosporangium arvum DSM 44712]